MFAGRFYQVIVAKRRSTSGGFRSWSPYDVACLVTANLMAGALGVS